MDIYVLPDNDLTAKYDPVVELAATCLQPIIRRCFLNGSNLKGTNSVSGNYFKLLIGSFTLPFSLPV